MVVHGTTTWIQHRHSVSLANKNISKRTTAAIVFVSRIDLSGLTIEEEYGYGQIKASFLQHTTGNEAQGCWDFYQFVTDVFGVADFVGLTSRPHRVLLGPLDHFLTNIEADDFLSTHDGEPPCPVSFPTADI